MPSLRGGVYWVNTVQENKMRKTILLLFATISLSLAVTASSVPLNQGDIEDKKIIVDIEKTISTDKNDVELLKLLPYTGVYTVGEDVERTPLFTLSRGKSNKNKRLNFAVVQNNNFERMVNFKS